MACGATDCSGNDERHRKGCDEAIAISGSRALLSGCQSPIGIERRRGPEVVLKLGSGSIDDTAATW